MTDAPKIHHKFGLPKWYSAKPARAKSTSSKISLITPDTMMGALPERLGSSGTLNMPQANANIMGTSRTST